MPRAATRHGADHEIHPVRGRHLVGVFAERQRADGHVRLAPLRDGDERAEHELEILLQQRAVRARIGAVRLVNGAAHHPGPVLLADLAAGERFEPIREVRQQHGPRQRQRHELRPVEQQQKRILGAFRPRRDHVDAHDARPLRVERDMPHARQMRAAVALFAPGHMGHRRPSCLRYRFCMPIVSHPPPSAQVCRRHPAQKAKRRATKTGAVVL